MDGETILTIFLTAVVTTGGTWLVTSYSHSRQEEKDEATRKEERDRHGTYLASRVAAVLDPYVMGCVDVTGDRGQMGEDGQMYASVDAPPLKLPDDVDWKSIDPHLMDRALTLPNEIDTANKAVSFTWLHVTTPPDNDEMFEERQYQWGRLGLLAMDLARDLRERYGLTQPDYSRYDPREWLEKAFRERDDMIKHGAEISKNLIEDWKKKQEGGPT